MMRALAAVALVIVLGMGTGLAGEAAGGQGAGGQQVPFRVFPLDSFGAEVKDWADESLPHYSIMTHVAEWENAFRPVGSGKPFTPNPEFFEKAQLVSISRVSAPPAPGQKVLDVKSLSIVGGELVLSYVFMEPPAQGGRKMKSTILVAYPANVTNPLRISEDTETPGTRFADAELEQAIREGRFKQVPPPQQ